MRSSSKLAFTGAVFLAFLICAISSCQKDDGPDDLDSAGTCRLVKMTFSEGPGITIGDTANFIYENDKIVRVNYDDYYTTLQYNGNRVTRVNYHEYGSNELESYNVVVYNNSWKIDSLIQYSIDPGQPDEAMFGHAFFYNTNGTPRRAEQLWGGPPGGGTGLSVSWSCDYTYAQQNITQMEKDGNLPAPWIIPFTYDNNENYFSKLPPEFVFADDYYFGPSAVHFLEFAHHLFTKNNITSVDGVPVSYKTDSRGNMIEYNYEGTFKATFTYDCP